MSSPLSGFTAVPNPQMLAFMGAQSFIMMFQAGEGWQYGKRRISAMSNEDFNKLTPLRLLQNQAANLRSSISTIEKSMNDMTPMIRTIISQYGDFLKEIISVTPPLVKDVSATVIKEAVKQTTGQDISTAVAEGIASGLAGPLLNIGQFIQEAQAQVPSGGTLETTVDETKVHDIPPPFPTGTGSIKTGFLAGPAPIPSIAQRFRTFEKTRNPKEKILDAMLYKLQQLKNEHAALIRSFKRGGGGRGGSQALVAAGKRFQSLRVNISALERQIVLQKVRIARR